jgi:predicted ArsR family transcriptional regulator
MDRRNFIGGVLRAGACCCGAAAGLGRSLGASGTQSGDWVEDLERRMIEGAETPAWRRYEKAQFWIKTLVDQVDAQLDREAGRKLLRACGRTCFQHTFGVAPEQKPSAEAVDQLLEALRKSGNEVSEENGRIVIEYRWGRDHQNPQGLILSDGYCMCPAVETGPEGLSPTFCQCSTGYVREYMERGLGRPVRVELLESLKMGGSDCRFRIEVSES